MFAFALLRACYASSSPARSSWLKVRNAPVAGVLRSNRRSEQLFSVSRGVRGGPTKSVRRSDEVGVLSVPAGQGST